MDWILSLILGVIASIIASIIFWIVTYKIKRSKIIIVNKIEKSKSLISVNGEKPYRYRIRLMNVKGKDLFEVSLNIKLYIRGIKSGIYNYTFLDTEVSNYLPVLKGKKHQKNDLYTKPYTTLTLSLAKQTINEIKKHIECHGEFESKINNHTVTLEDLFEEFKDRIIIQIYVFGNEDSSGARRCFCSELLDYNSIVEGKFCNPKLKDFKKYKDFKKAINEIKIVNKEKNL